MISYNDALDIILENTPLAATEATAPVGGRFAATGVESPINVPGFANSAMDGYAVCCATDGHEGAKLRVLGMVTAGMAAPTGNAEPGSAWEIMTGAPVPDGYDGVIPVERTGRDGDTVTLNQDVKSGANVRLAGEDFNQGETVLQPGEKLTAETVMGLAAIGVNSIEAYRQPRVGIVTTGNELSDKEQKLGAGMIHDSNRPFLENAVARAGAVLAESCSVVDEKAALQAKVAETAKSCDIILTTGGVSAGRLDFVPSALAELGAEILFHKVAIRPGKPVLFAKLPDGTLVFGLPGNPVAVAACFRFFVTAAIRRMQGQSPETFEAAFLETEHSKRAELRFFGKAERYIDDQGKQCVRVLPGQQSFRIQPLMKSNCWVIIEENRDIIAAGETVRIAPL